MSFVPNIVGQVCRILPFFLTPSASLPAHSPVIAGKSESRRPVIVDSDLSHDDMLAILYLLQHPEIEIVGITVVEGVAPVKDGIENTRRMLAMAGREDIPVAGGPEKPLAGNNAFPETWRRGTASGLSLNFSPTAEPQNMPASALIQHLVERSAAPIQIIALGPLTNIALALQKNPALSTQIASIVVSGGSINALDGIRESSGSANKISEWNIWVDPLACDIVFRSGVKLMVIPLDVTDPGDRSLLISRRVAKELSATAQWREAKFASNLFKFMFLENRSEAIPVWDVPVAALAVDPHLGTDWRDLHLYVTTDNPETAGQTLVDDTRQPNAQVCFAGNQTAFEEAYLQVFQ